MKSWLKGGLIGLVVGVILIILGVFLFGFGASFLYNFLGIFSFLIILPVYFVKYVLNCTQTGCMFLVLFISIVIVPLECFLIGAIIGLIVGKVKNKKKFGKFFK